MKGEVVLRTETGITTPSRAVYFEAFIISKSKRDIDDI